MNKSSKLLKQLWNSSKTIVRHHPYPVPFRHFLQNNYPGPQYAKLTNGLTIATEERPDQPNVCFGLYIDAGSRYESSFENGIAHFFEHLAFKGTTTRNKRELQAIMNSTGAIFRCFTSREMVCYYVQCLATALPAAAEVLIDCVFRNSLSKSDIECQKTVTYGEMLQHDENTTAVIYDFLHSAAFQGTPLANTVQGPSSNLYNFNVDTICTYLKRCFNPCRTVLVAVGGVKHDNIVKLAECYMSSLEPLQCNDIDIYRYTAADVRYRDDSMPVTNVLMALEGPCWCEDDNIVMEIARYAVGSWDRSQLGGMESPWPLARGAAALGCDCYKSFNINFKDTGLWGIHLISHVMAIEDLTTLVFEEWMRLCLCITESEVERAKRFYKAKYLSKMQSAVKTCHDVGRWTLYNGSRPTLLEKITAIERVQAKDVREVCSRYIYDKCFAVAAIGRIEGLHEYSRLLTGTYWLRY